MVVLTSTRADEYDYDYFERGPQTGKSLYEKYRWMPERTIPYCHHMVQYLGIRREDRILDFGCAKGFYVHALRLMGYQAWGCEISDYALATAHPDVHESVGKFDEMTMDRSFNWVLFKDVLEHIETPAAVLEQVRERTEHIFVIVPLGDNGRYFVPEYEQDVTHVIHKPLHWWKRLLEVAGYKNVTATLRVLGLKDEYAHYPYGNGFLLGDA